MSHCASTKAYNSPAQQAAILRLEALSNRAARPTYFAAAGRTAGRSGSLRRAARPSQGFNPALVVLRQLDDLQDVEEDVDDVQVDLRGRVHVVVGRDLQSAPAHQQLRAHTCTSAGTEALGCRFWEDYT